VQTQMRIMRHGALEMKPAGRFGLVVLCALAALAMAGCGALGNALDLLAPQSNLTMQTMECSVTGLGKICTPVAGAFVSGEFVSPEDAYGPPVGNVYSFASPDPGTNFNGTYGVPNAALPGEWVTAVNFNAFNLNAFPWCDPAIGDANLLSTFVTDTWTCIITGQIPPVPSPTIVYADSLPSTITVNAPSQALSTAYGMPTLTLFQETSASYVNTIPATSVSGNSATFPFPKQANGAALAPTIYAFQLWDGTKAGGPTNLGFGYLPVATRDMTKETPYGVSAFDSTLSSYNCYISSASPTETCSNSGVLSSTPGYAVTLATPDQVCVNSVCGATGITPVAVSTFGVTTTAGTPGGSCDINPYTGYWACSIATPETSAPSKVITANYGSSNVSILSLPGMTPVATVPVGGGPVSVLISPDQTKAFVANYNSASISEIDLSSNTVIATLAVGSGPSALTLDPSNSYFWIGGDGYVSKVAISTFTVVSTVPISGQITALGISAAQNRWVYTTVSADRTSFAVADAAITTASPVINSEANLATANSDFIIVRLPGAPPPWVGTSIVISSSLGNGIAVTTTPAGFAVTDIVNHTNLISATTASPVRGIATDASQSIAYLTEPESNTILTVPIPAPTGLGNVQSVN
jgi:YVTN family beta-propeller protein